MRRALVVQLAASTMLWLSVTSCRPAERNAEVRAGNAAVVHGGNTPTVHATPLILNVDEGERRTRRFAVSAPHFILKVDPQNGGSSDLTMGYEDLPPGGAIPPHWHKVADEIVFVHRGSGVVELGDRHQSVSAGATIHIPKDVRITL